MKCDVAVIGGGVIGLACAWRLAQGGAKVALFQTSNRRHAASWAAAGMLAPLVEAARHPPQDPSARAAMLDLGLRSKALYPDFVQEVWGTRSEFLLSSNLLLNDPQTGFVYLATDEDDAAPQRFNSWSDQKPVQPLHFDTASFSEAESRIIQPVTRELAESGRAFWLPQEGWVDNRKLWKFLLRSAQCAGVTLWTDPVHAVEVFGWSVNHVVTGKRRIECGNVLLCAGAWSAKIEGLPADCMPPVRPVKGHMLALTRPHGLFSRVFYTSVFYLVPRNENLLIGATMEERGDFWRDARGVWKLLDAAQRVFPKLLDQQIAAHWTGLRPATPDGLPILGRTPLENLFVATGHFRNGILLAPITAQLMADCILHGKEPPREFSINRFYTS